MKLTDEEKTIVEIFVTDQKAYDTIYKILKSQVETKRYLFTRNITSRKDLTNEQIGANLRSFDEANLMINGIFRELIMYRKVQEVRHENPGK